MATSYTLLESTASKALGIQNPNFNASAPSFYASTSFLLMLSFVILATAGFVMFGHAGVIRLAASEQAISKSNAEFKRVILGLLGVFLLFPLLYSFNKDLLLGDIGLTGLRAARAGVAAGGSLTNVVPTQVSSITNSKSCTDTQSAISSLSSGNVCRGAQCSALAGCNYQQYLDIINQESNRVGVDPALTIVIMCRESHGVVNPPPSAINDNGTTNCGLMQVNQSGACTPNILDPRTNISLGVSKIKEKLTTAKQVYPGVPPLAGVFAAYNCCGNGDNPNAASRDCNESSGFSSSIPKWACPINPGTGSYSMCAVKNYACDLNACFTQLKGGT
ncbi:MAG: hypothetical protein JWN37_151 [Candidatus Nomurabacteria bacterium]|nr:hypothetical protein [Candidatus Nomurabacteria bacterium]